MSYFDEMIATESIPDSYVGWEQYRREVTEYIENNCRVKKESGQDADAANIYYAESTMYDGVSHQVFAGDGDVFLWDEEGNYYLME